MIAKLLKDLDPAMQDVHLGFLFCGQSPCLQSAASSIIQHDVEVLHASDAEEDGRPEVLRASDEEDVAAEDEGAQGTFRGP